MDVHTILLINRRTNVFFQGLRCNSNMHRVGNNHWLALNGRDHLAVDWFYDDRWDYGLSGKCGLVARR